MYRPDQYAVADEKTPASCRDLRMQALLVRESQLSTAVSHELAMVSPVATATMLAVTGEKWNSNGIPRMVRSVKKAEVNTAWASQDTPGKS